MAKNTWTIATKSTKKLGVQPARSTDELAKLLRARQSESDDTIDKSKARVISTDATDRPIGRHTDYETQKEYYSGKHRQHGVKNTIIADEYQFIHFLGDTHRGAQHDKALADQEIPDFTADCYKDLWFAKDTGYQGYQNLKVYTY